MKISKKEVYIYNPQTLKYERHRTSVRSKLFRAIGFLVLTLISSFGLNRFISTFFPAVQYKKLKVELNELRGQYTKLNEYVDLMSAVLDNVQERDANVHRMVFGLDPIDSSIWHGGIGGHQPYAKYNSLENRDLLAGTLEKVDKLSRQLTIQSKSLDQIERLAADKEKYLNSIPSIKPVNQANLKKDLSYLSGFGMRMHPVYKIPKLHTGLDFTAPIGTMVQSTGDGVVKIVEKKNNGYGHNVVIDHGYGYQTRYAHLSAILVKRGQKVKKGESIGEVGNTGTSTAPHLHYEVIYQGKPIDPINFVMDGLTPEEYNEIVKQAKEANKSLD